MKERFFRILTEFGFSENTNEYYSEYGYTPEQLSDYSEMIKRAFKMGTYTINCDYGVAWISIGEHKKPISFEKISDKLIALVIYLATLKTKNSRYMFGRYLDKVMGFNEIYDAIMTSYPYSNMNNHRKMSIEDARTKLPKILECVNRQ